MGAPSVEEPMAGVEVDAKDIEADADAVEMEVSEPRDGDMVIIVGKLVKNTSRKGLFRENSACEEP